MKRYGYKFLVRFWIIVILLIPAIPVNAESDLNLTREEQAYIEEHNVLKASVADGAAPLLYVSAAGEVRGISRLVLDEVSRRTGLVFAYEIHDTPEEALASDSDVFLAISQDAVPDDMALSVPFLRSESILYLNSKAKTQDFSGRTLAAVKGSALPEGVEKGNVIYYDTDRESLQAVERGEADYGYTDAYTLAFYIMNNGTGNIAGIPQGRESREYCIGLAKENVILLSIVNKSIEGIDANQMQKIILDAMEHSDRKMNFSLFAHLYDKQISVAIGVIIAMLVLSVFSYVRVNRRLSMQNKKHELLSALSDEYFYEYYPEKDRLELSENCRRLFKTAAALEAATPILKRMFLQAGRGEYTETITLPLADGVEATFKAVNSYICDDNGKVDSVIGKLIDISAETAEKEALLFKAQVDGLTGLYNSITAKTLISERLADKERRGTDAFMLMDYDDFKQINDTYGHLIGDRMLEQLGKSLKRTFRSTDIIGRVGGDEFAVYLKDVRTVHLVQEKYRQAMDSMRAAAVDIPVSVSAGIVFVDAEAEGEPMTYEAVFKMADAALYQAKRDGKGRAVVCAAAGTTDAEEE